MSIGRRLIVPGLVALGYVLAFLQRPGKAVYDSRIELSADPSLFLHRVTSVWSPTVDLGHVQSGQFVGYLFPMAPWFAAGHAAGVPTWIVERLWMGTILALAAYGIVRLLDALYDRPRGLAHVAAAVLYIANPYVVVYASRGTVTLLAYAALPWLLLAAKRGIAEPHRWRWPAVMALALAAAGGGVNFAVLFWVGLAPLALVAYEVLVRGRSGRAAWQFLWRAGLCAIVACLWWVVPVMLSSSGHTDFLTFTEQPDSILLTSSMSESLRLMGYWVTYLGVGIGGSEPLVPAASTYLFSAPVIVASFIVPLLALGGARYLRGWAYAPFLGLLMVGGLVVMSLGFPPGTPMYKAFQWAYYNVPLLQPLRTTYKAAPLAALPLACLAGASLAALVTRARAARLYVLRTRIPAVGLVVAFVAVAVLFARPLVTGSAIDPQQAYGSIPKTWTAAVHDASRTAPRNHRLMVLPGELFGNYRWGNTYNSIAPALTKREVLVREIERHADPVAAQLQVTVDELVQQARLVPGQLDPLLALMGVGQVIVAADSHRLRSGALDPVTLQRSLQGQQGFATPMGNYGRPRRYDATPGRSGSAILEPDLRRYQAPSRTGPGIVRIHPVRRPTVLDGDADGVASLAAVGSLGVDRALLYAANLNDTSLAQRVSDGAELSFTDSNRRRQLINSRLTEDTGPTLTPGEPFGEVWPSYNPFPSRGTAGRTVAVYTGLSQLYSPRTPGFTLFPQSRPYAALDGRRDTAWIADDQHPRDRYLYLALSRPLNVDHITIFPHSDGLGTTRAVAISVNGGPELPIRLHPGENRVGVRASPLRSLRIRITRVAGFGFIAGQGGIDELRIPGLRVREALRLPTDLASRAHGLDLRDNPFSIVLQRTTADFPYRAGRDIENAQEQNPLDMVDAEPGMRRIVSLPASRSFSGDGWASVRPGAPDDLLDGLAGGLPSGWSFTSSSRFEGVPGRRASSAFDGDPRTAWSGDLLDNAPRPWIAFRAPRTITIRRFQIVSAAGAYRFPARVQVSTASGPVTTVVRPGGWVVLPHPIRASGLRIDILSVQQASAYQARRKLRAVGIAELRIPGLNPPRPNRTGTIATRCGELAARARGQALPLQVRGSVAALDAGEALALRPCGPAGGRLALPAGASTLAVDPGAVMRADYLRLRSPAPDRSPPGAPSPGLLTASGGATDDSRWDGVRLALHAPAWIVLGQSWSNGWRAWCRTPGGRQRPLGAPTLIDGFANGWRVGADCREVHMFFTPQRVATGSYLASAIVGLLLLLIAVVGFLGGRRRETPPTRRAPAAPSSTSPPDVERMPAPIAGGAGLEPPPRDRLVLLSWPGALALGLAAALIGELFFGLRGAAILGALAVAFARQGASAERLLAVAALGLIAVPIIYLATPVGGARAGFDFSFAIEHLPAHYVALGAVACAGAAFALDAVRLRRRSAARSPTHTSAAAANTTSESSAP